MWQKLAVFSLDSHWTTLSFCPHLLCVLSRYFPAQCNTYDLLCCMVLYKKLKQIYDFNIKLQVV